MESVAILLPKDNPNLLSDEDLEVLSYFFGEDFDREEISMFFKGIGESGNIKPHPFPDFMSENQ